MMYQGVEGPGGKEDGMGGGSCRKEDDNWTGEGGVAAREVTLGRTGGGEAGAGVELQQGSWWFGGGVVSPSNASEAKGSRWWWPGRGQGGGERGRAPNSCG